MTNLSGVNEERVRRLRLGRFLSWAGSFWLLLVVAANFGLLRALPFAEFLAGTLFFPFAMLWAGRVLKRRNPPSPPQVPTSSGTRMTRRPPPPVAERLPAPEPSFPELFEFEEPTDPVPVELEPIEPEPSFTIDMDPEDIVFDVTGRPLKSSDEMIAEAKERLRSDW